MFNTLFIFSDRLLKMVVVSSKESYCHGIMQAMNRLRLEGKLCDISLVVKDKTIDAHRCILVAGSDYFKSRFIGPFKADIMPQVDLSAITDDIAAVELMLNFLYTGEVTIDVKNVEPILKVSSFFMITELRDLCTHFMEKNIALDKCLKYFLLSVDHMIPEIGKKLEQTVKSRFHDYLIFDSQSIEITPDQLLYLIQSCQIFENCSNVDILVYVHHWVESGKSEAHELLGCDILELVCSRGREVQNVYVDLDTESSESFERLRTDLDCAEPKSVFHDKLKRIATKCFTKSKSETKVLHPLKSRSPKPSKASNIQSESEDVLITISPKQNLRELVDRGESVIHCVREDETVFDMCVYIPRTRSWHYLHKGLSKDFFQKICYGDTSLTHCLSGDKLTFLFPFKEKIEILHLNEFKWTTIDYKHIEPSGTDLETYDSEFCLCTNKQVLYLLLIVNVFSNEVDDVFQIYFKCFRLTPENNWLFMFNTPRINTDDQYGPFTATISPKSNEMVILYVNSDELHTFVSEIDSDNVSNSKVHHFARQSDDVFLCDGLHILESRGHFFLLTSFFTSKASARVTCSFKYKYLSRQLDPVLDTSLNVDDKALQFSIYKRYPCEYKYSACDKNSLWLLSGTEDHGSSLIEVSIDNKGKLVYQCHKPPPFSRVIAIVPGTIDSACLTPLKTITKYLSG